MSVVLEHDHGWDAFTQVAGNCDGMSLSVAGMRPSKTGTIYTGGAMCARHGSTRETPKRIDADSRIKNRQLWRHSGIRDAASKLVCDERVPGLVVQKGQGPCIVLFKSAGKQSRRHLPLGSSSKGSA